MDNRSGYLVMAIVAILLVGAGGLALDATGRARVGFHRGQYEPAATSLRPVGLELDLPEVQSVSAFDVAEDRLYVLDVRGTMVHSVSLEGAGPAYEGAFGKRGGGPGEFVNPTGIAVLRNRHRVAVIEPGRIHLFDLDGGYVESLVPDLPCLMPRASIASAARGIFVYGNCVRRAVGGDTMMAVLAWSPDGRSFTRIASDPLYTLDGRFGSAFGSTHPFGEGSNGRHVFGSGLQRCIFMVTETDSVPIGHRTCDLALRTFPLRLRRETRAALERVASRNPMMARTAVVPDEHPPYSQPLMTAAGPVLLRGYSEDSLVLRSFGSEEDLAVLPLTGLVGCRREGCLVVKEHATGTLARLHRISDLLPGDRRAAAR